MGGDGGDAAHFRAAQVGGWAAREGDWGRWMWAWAEVCGDTGIVYGFQRGDLEVGKPGAALHVNV